MMGLLAVEKAYDMIEKGDVGCVACIEGVQNGWKVTKWSEFFFAEIVVN